MSEYGNEQVGLVYAENPDVVADTSNPMNVYSGDHYDYGRTDEEVLADTAECYLDLAEESEDGGIDVIAVNEEMVVPEEEAEFKIIDIQNNDMSDTDVKGDIINMPEMAFNAMITQMIDRFENEKPVIPEYHPETQYDDYSEMTETEEVTVIDDTRKDLEDAMREAEHDSDRVIDDVTEVKVPQFY